MILLGIGTLFATLASANGCINDASRAWFSMGRDHYLPAWFGAVHPVYRTPYRSIIFLVPIALVFALGAPLDQVITFSILSAESQASAEKDWQPFLDDMARSIGRPVKAYYGSNYTALVEAMRATIDYPHGIAELPGSTTNEGKAVKAELEKLEEALDALALARGVQRAERRLGAGEEPDRQPLVRPGLRGHGQRHRPRHHRPARARAGTCSGSRP